MTRATPILTALMLALTLTACGKGGKPDEAKAAAAKPVAPLLLAPEDLRQVGQSGLIGAPVITGAIQPARRADLRAEVAAVVLQVAKDNGERVRTGDLIIRLDPTAIRDSLTSAEEALRAAQQSFEQAERVLSRQRTLNQQGMISMQGLEDAEVRRNAAQSELAAAKARVVTARQQVSRTEVRAPFDGVVSERKISVGDTVTWTNQDQVPHTATAEDRAVLQSGTISPGSSFSQVFETAGEFPYFCEFHSNMTGTIVVQ